MRDCLFPPLPPEARPRADRGSPATVSIAALAAIACQVTVVATDDQIGAICNACLVAVLALAASGRRAADSTQAAYLALSLLPLLALARLVMPQNSIESDLWPLVVAVPVIAGAVLLTFIHRDRVLRLVRPALSPGWRLAIAVSGAPIGLFAFGLADAAGENRDSAGLTAALVLFVAGAVDELLFRGALQRSLEWTYGPDAFIVSGVLYTATLLGDSPVTVALGGVLGLAFGFLVARTNALLSVAVAHGLLNVVWGVLAPYAF